MYGQFQEDGRPDSGSSGRPSAPDAGDKSFDIKQFVKRAILAIREAADNKTKIILWQKMCNAVENFLPNPDHPAIKIAHDFFNKKADVFFIASNLAGKFNQDIQFFIDICEMPECKNAIKKYKDNNETTYKVYDISRNLKSEGEKEYIKGFISDLKHNCTRALIGSFTGTVAISQSSQPGKIDIAITVKNELNWVSATRFPPSWGGYSGDPETQQSLIENEPGWSTKMAFHIYI